MISSQLNSIFLKILAQFEVLINCVWNRQFGSDEIWSNLIFIKSINKTPFYDSIDDGDDDSGILFTELDSLSLSLSLSLAGVEFRAALPDISIEKRLRLIVCELPSVSFFIFSLFTEDNIATLMVAVCWWSFESDDCAATPPTSFTFMPPTRINESDEPILSTWPSLLLLWISMSLNWFLLNWINVNYVNWISYIMIIYY